MNTQANEQAFEAQVEATLLGPGGWYCGTTAEWDVERALFPTQVCTFLAETQPTLWEQMRALHGTGLDDLLINALVKELDIKGTLHVLRHGFKFYGKTFRLAYFKPAHALNDEVLALYAQNKLTITRQVSCHPNKRDTVDLLFALNGLPVATCELKNPGTGQSWRQAVWQYQEDRDPRAPLFRFKTRALVHFAADPDEVHMSTRLNGEDTRFLPFNRGSHPGQVQCGAGNPHLGLPHLHLDRDDAVIKLGSEVALQYYRLERVSSGPINVSEGEPQHVRPPTEVGTGRVQDPKAPLSEIIEVLNERFGTQFNEVDRLFFQQIKEKACNDETVVETARVNPRDRFELGIKSHLDELMIERMSENDQIAERYLSDETFRSLALPILARAIFEDLQTRGTDAPVPR